MVAIVHVRVCVCFIFNAKRVCTHFFVLPLLNVIANLCNVVGWHSSELLLRAFV